MERHGLFMIEDGQTIFLWVGRDAVPQLVMDVFNLPSYEVLRGGKVFFSAFTLHNCLCSF
jgi:protein transport protein SEC24